MVTVKRRNRAPLLLLLFLFILYVCKSCNSLSDVHSSYRQNEAHSNERYTDAAGFSFQYQCTVAASPNVFKSWVTRKNYTRAFLRPRYISDIKLPSLQVINGTIFPDFQTIDGIHNWGKRPRDKTLSPKCPPVVEVDLPADLSVTDTRKILFGVATTIERLKRMTTSILSYLGQTNASMLVMVPPTSDLEGEQTWFRSRGLDVTLKSSDGSWTYRYFCLIRALSDHIKAERQDTTWVSFVDDDTFFPSLQVISNRLSQYNENEKHYIGALSEAQWLRQTFGNIGFGGAGVFLSKVLLDEINQHYNECQDLGDLPGDQKLARCIFQYAHTELTVWQELHQFDITGEPDGIFESGRELQSLHHWASWFHRDITKIFAVSVAAGQQSAPKRWKFNEREEDGKKTYWILNNGYSIIEYIIEKDAKEIDFNAIERTWDWPTEGFTEGLGPLRAKDQEGVEKRRWMLDEVVISDGNVHQFYHRDTATDASVIELVWLGT